MDAPEMERISTATRPEYLGSRISAERISSELKTMQSSSGAVEIQIFKGHPRPLARVMAIDRSPLRLLQQSLLLPQRRWFPISCNLVSTHVTRVPKEF